MPKNSYLQVPDPESFPRCRGSSASYCFGVEDDGPDVDLNKKRTEKKANSKSENQNIFGNENSNC